MAKNKKIPLGITIGAIATGMRLVNEYAATKAAAPGNSRAHMDHMLKITTGYVTPYLESVGGGTAGWTEKGEAFSTWAPVGIGYVVSTYVGGKKNGQGLGLNSKFNIPLFKL